MSGLEAVISGWLGVVDGATKWIGGFLIFLVLAVATVPLGLLFRHLVGKVNIPPLTGAVFTGMAVSVGLMFVLHPAMYPGISVFTVPVLLPVVHVLAGVAGGYTWWMIEQPSAQTSQFNEEECR